MADGATADQIFRMPPLGDPNVGGMINVMFLEPGASVETVLDFSGHSHYLATEVFVDEPGFAEIAVGDGPVIEPPVANVTVELVDFAYVMPDQIKAGPTWWSLSNNSAQSHDLGIYKLEGDLTVEMVMAQLDAGDVDANLPPPVTSVPSAAVGMGQAYWMKYDLTPGNYVALCRVPDFSTMPPGPDHRHMGMVHEFTVAP